MLLVGVPVCPYLPSEQSEHEFRPFVPLLYAPTTHGSQLLEVAFWKKPAWQEMVYSPPAAESETQHGEV
jgi:hypothetical protein